MSTYNKLLIYYFSGTGNAKNVALTLEKEANTRGMETEVYNLCKTDRHKITMPDKDGLVAFVSLVHGFNYRIVLINQKSTLKSNYLQLNEK